MKTSFFALIALAFAGATPGFADIVYDNTATDTLVTYFYSGGPFDQIGDSINLGGIKRVLSDAAIQFYNGSSSSGTFTAMLSFWTAGGPVGSQIGSTYTLNGLTIAGNDVLTVNFSSLNLTVPSSLVFLVGVSNVAPGLDLGLNVFTHPGGIGSSDASKIVTAVSSVFSEGPTTPGAGNLYLQLQAVPEPSTWMSLSAAGLMLVAARRKTAPRS